MHVRFQNKKKQIQDEQKPVLIIDDEQISIKQYYKLPKKVIDDIMLILQKNRISVKIGPEFTLQIHQFKGKDELIDTVKKVI